MQKIKLVKTFGNNTLIKLFGTNKKLKLKNICLSN